MKFPNKLRTHCPNCNTHQVMKIRLPSKGRASSMAFGVRRHEVRLTGYVGKVAGKKSVKKQGKTARVIMECPNCKKKTERVIHGRTREILEIQRG